MSDGPAPQTKATSRLFFALWPDEPSRAALADATQEFVRGRGGRPVPAGNFHVTLAFLGSVREELVPELLAIARDAALVTSSMAGGGANRVSSSTRPVVTLAFDRLEYWRKPQLLCATASGPSESSGRHSTAVELAALLKTRLTAAGFTPDSKPFRAHVTLARKVPPPREAPSVGARPAMHPVQWSFREFVLVDSRTEPDGSLYSVLDSWLLCAESTQKPVKKG